jgi:fluoride ion exporter CrcB/FEX
MRKILSVIVAGSIGALSRYAVSLLAVKMISRDALLRAGFASAATKTA